jgi:hypothetical protein
MCSSFVYFYIILYADCFLSHFDIYFKGEKNIKQATSATQPFISLASQAMEAQTCRLWRVQMSRTALHENHFALEFFNTFCIINLANAACHACSWTCIINLTNAAWDAAVGRFEISWKFLDISSALKRFSLVEQLINELLPKSRSVACSYSKTPPSCLQSVCSRHLQRHWCNYDFSAVYVDGLDSPYESAQLSPIHMLSGIKTSNLSASAMIDGANIVWQPSNTKHASMAVEADLSARMYIEWDATA